MIRALIFRLSLEEAIRVSIATSIKGGHGGVLNEIKGFQRALKAGAIPLGVPDLLIVLRDANCGNFNEIKREIINIIDNSVFPFFVVGCPDPHVERWFLLDSNSLMKVFGSFFEVPAYKCEKNYYKNELKSIIRQAGWPITQGGIEYAHDIVSQINFSHAERNDPSFRIFISDLRGVLKNIKTLS